LGNFDAIGWIGAVPSGIVAEKAPPMKGSRSFMTESFRNSENEKLGIYNSKSTFFGLKNWPESGPEILFSNSTLKSGTGIWQKVFVSDC